MTPHTHDIIVRLAHVLLDAIYAAWLLLSFFIILPLWRICTKAGRSGALALFQLIPFGLFFVLYILAFKPWPVLAKAVTVTPIE